MKLKQHPDISTEIPVVILAAGKSTRMGVPKGLVEINEKTWIELQIDHLIENDLKNIVCVLGHYEKQYREVIDTFSSADGFRELNIAITVNRDPDRGQFSSIQEGLKFILNDEVWSQAKGVFILPVDVPVATADVWSGLADTVSEFLIRDYEERFCAAIPEFQERGGHPVLLSMEFVRELVKLKVQSEEARLDHQIHKLQRDQILRFETKDSNVVKNFNNPEDFQEKFPNLELKQRVDRVNVLASNYKKHYPTERDLTLAKADRIRREKEQGLKMKKKKLRKHNWNREE